MLTVLAVQIDFPPPVGATIWVTEPDAHRITQVSADGTFVTPVIEGLGQPYGIAVDAAAGYVYWADRDYGQIWRADLDGTNGALMTAGQSQPHGLAIDATRIYWTSETDGNVYSLPKGGGSPTLVSIGNQSGAGIVAGDSHVFWADSALGVIRKAPAAGGSTNTLGSVLNPFAVAFADGYVYHGGNDDLARVAAGGGAPTTLFSSVGTLGGMTYDASAADFYYTRPVSGDLWRYDVGANSLETIATNLSNPRGVATFADPGLSQPADKCIASKLKAIAKLQKGLLLCHAKVAQKGDASILADCEQKAQSKVADAFVKAGTCSGDAALCTTLAGQCANEVRDLLPDGASPATASKCEAARLKAAAKLTASLLGCASKAAKAGVPIAIGEGSCVAKAQAKYTAAFDKVSGCSGDGQASVVQRSLQRHCPSAALQLDASLNVVALCP